MGKFGEPIVPVRLLSRREVSVGAARTGDQKAAGHAYAQRLCTKHRQSGCGIQRMQDVPVTRHAVKAGDAWPVTLEFCCQARDTFDELRQWHLTGARGCMLDHIGEAESEFEQCSIVFGFQPRDTESAPRRLA
jgi:hypothetical protein